MRRLVLHRQKLPGIGERLEFETEAGPRVVVVVHRTGGYDLGIRKPDDDHAEMFVHLTDAESVALAGVLVHGSDDAPLPGSAVTD